MVRRHLKAVMAVSMLASGAPVFAGVYTDDMGKCIVRSASDADQTTFMQWFFAAMSASPAVRPMSMVTAAQRDALNVRVAALMERLTLKDCRSQTRDALKYEGMSALESGFGLLGQVAARNLIGDPAVQKEMQGFAARFDRKAWADFLKESGIPDTSMPPGK